MPLGDNLIILLMLLILGLALATVEIRDPLYSILSFCGMSIGIGMLYWLLMAPYVALYQLLVYAGAVVGLYLAAIMLTTRKEATEL
ncbi:MAG: NADH-quinone oxidoreductase subunit J [Promethearchaeia archaeon]